MAEGQALKPVIWIGSSRKDLVAFPEAVQDHMGYALYIAQRGGNTQTPTRSAALAGQGSWKW